MLDEKTELMLKVASELTADDLETLRTLAPAVEAIVVAKSAEVREAIEASLPGEPSTDEPFDGGTAVTPTRKRRRQRRIHGSTSTLPQGEYERQRTRESKISTACVGREREKHEWWPIGTELVGDICNDSFTAVVVENPQVKSGRSIQITSGPANGKVYRTPTRAAIEATETYRQAKNLGRSGGVTNGWTFWQPRP